MKKDKLSISVSMHESTQNSCYWTFKCAAQNMSSPKGALKRKTKSLTLFAFPFEWR